MSDWPLIGVTIAFVLTTVIVGFAAWSYLSAAPAQPSSPPQAPLAFDRDKAFAEFRARALGLPTVWTYPTAPHKRAAQ
jgi:hypothetical protein